MSKWVQQRKSKNKRSITWKDDREILHSVNIQYGSKSIELVHHKLSIWFLMLICWRVVPDNNFFENCFDGHYHNYMKFYMKLELSFSGYKQMDYCLKWILKSLGIFSSANNFISCFLRTRTISVMQTSVGVENTVPNICPPSELIISLKIIFCYL